MKLSEKLKQFGEAQNLTGSEVEFQSRVLGTRISSPLWYKIINNGFNNISTPRLLVISQVCGCTLRYLADENAKNDLDAIKIESSCLSKDDKKKLIKYLEEDIQQ